MSGIVEVLRRRGAALAVSAALALAVSAVETRTAEDVNQLAALLSEASESVVKPEDVRWEPSQGVLSDLFRGRFVLFLGSAAADRPRDVHRARVRLTPEGRALGVSGAYNLTSTPLGDDHALVVRGDHAAYATFSYGKEQGVTALALSGEGAESVATKLTDKVMAWVTNAQQTGSGDGVGRINVTFDQPAQRVGLAIVDAPDSSTLAIDVVDDRSHHRGRLDLKKGEMIGESAMHADAAKHLPKRLVHWAVDTVRAVSWIGPAPIAWLEEKTFAIRDAVKQTTFKITKSGDALAREGEAPVAAAILDTSQASVDLGHWPPAPIHPMWKTPEPGEGEWTTPKPSWIKKLPAAPNGEAPPSPFYETFVRPDEERPYAKVLLVAMDMRQLDVGIEAGSEDPKPLTGPPGTGRIPRDPQVYQRVAAAFNGGFKTEHGNYGMMLNKRVLLPPQPGAATVILTRDGRVGMGSWGSNTTVGNIHDVPTADIQSFRQNLDPLVDSDKVNPSGRGQWGFVLPGTSMQTERSGICVTAAGHMMYAWGDDTSATSLANAMKMAGCVYGMHLDMNPHHTGFLYTNIDEFKGKQYKSELLTTKMEIDTDRYLLYAPKDFFFMMLRDPEPPQLGVASADKTEKSEKAERSAPARGEHIEWTPDPGAQPAPSWMAGLWRGHSGNVELLDIEPARASFRARAGMKEPDGSTPRERRSKDRRNDDDDDVPVVKALAPRAGSELSEDDAHRVLFALTLGTSDPRHLRGLAADGQTLVPFTSDARSGVLSITEEGVLSIASAAEAKSAGVPAHGDAVELPLIVDDRAPVAHGATHGRALIALGITTAGRAYIARGPSIEDIAQVLERAGCARAVLLDRGAGDHGALSRAGTPTPPRSHYDETTLYAMGKPLVPRGFRFESSTPVPPPAPKKK